MDKLKIDFLSGLSGQSHQQKYVVLVGCKGRLISFQVFFLVILVHLLDGLQNEVGGGGGGGGG